ncbi:bifunctional [glutamine synthetase] adenylyltransferase/[glutamine synthetase]-adenylyl-L-tyrosine phosphorylase [Millisia brevis]|uniref:bifunctional [glutamine synthetase] adenylyltransferase/[glutamine synthetase]-adenylyl-L-tyrosine phosphorylase n=1 Tax=Millisia brevis TaxID=264148 RepID=UPI000836F37A|nr:bifunctional [glutamine synthetase] adenylyltransferase/[glutamine synthetase]-adenylyl-L-tyrosine phosphorylase [Millisia brevis]
MSPTGRSVIPGPGRLGLLEERSSEYLVTLGWNDEGSVELMWALSRSPNPDLALRALVRMREQLGDAWPELDTRLRTSKRLRGRLFGLFGSSITLGDHLVAQPQRWHLLDTDEMRLPTRDQLIERLLAAVEAVPEQGPNATELLHRAGVTGPKATLLLREAYRDELLLLAALDVAAVVEDEPVLPFREVGEHLADLADAALTAALAVAIAVTFPGQPCPVRLAVIAMGKCGARELNYVSDVDVIFVAEPADRYAARLAGELMRFASATFFEVDAALRPEGKQGDLVRSLDSHLAYYQRWAKTWEFQALLKARPMTGDMELGRCYHAAVSPMVWTASEREDFVSDTRAMRRRVEQNVPAPMREREIKLGYGGLRDVEFAVQLLQLVHGRLDDSLHERDTLDALAALGRGGYVGRDDAANLAASYEFLRVIEHRLQLQRMVRTHTLPPDDDEEAMRWLARAAHIRPDGRHDAAGVLREDLKRNTRRVRRLHQKLFYRPLLESVVRFDTETLRMSPQAAARQMAALGYQAPEHALGHLRALVEAPGRRGQIQRVLLPTLLEWLGDTPDPDSGLLAYRRLCEQVGDAQWYLRTLRDEGPVAERLMHVLGTSIYLQNLLLKVPEIIRIYGDGPAGPMLLAGEPEDSFRAILASSARHDDPVRAVAAVRALRRRELARIASADVLGFQDVRQVCKALSSVWAAAINAALDAAIRASVRDLGEPAPAKIAVIGVGRLGGAELGYGSDADVLFVCEPREDADESGAVRWANQIADRLRTLLGAPSADPPLQVDADLRPEGRSGPLVRSLESYRVYYDKWVEPWEVQALLRAHQVAGDEDLGIRFLHMVDPIRYPEGGVSPETVREIRRIKARVDSERLPKGADPKTHTKLGRGGLTDIEWTVQLLQLRFAGRYPSLHNTSTLESLDACEKEGLLSGDDAARLRDAWLLVTRTRNALVLAKGKPTDQLPTSGQVLNAVAVIASDRSVSGGDFLDEYLRITRRARVVVERIFGE